MFKTLLLACDNDEIAKYLTKKGTGLLQHNQRRHCHAKIMLFTFVPHFFPEDQMSLLSFCSRNACMFEFHYIGKGQCKIQKFISMSLSMRTQGRVQGTF